MSAPRRMDATLRWVLPRLIEQTARDAGHLDLLRESIRGVTDTENSG